MIVRTKPRPRRILYVGCWVVMALAVALLAAGCGGSGSSSESTSSSETGTKGGDGTSFDAAALESKLKPYLTLPKSIPVTEPLNERPTGQLVEYLECSADPCKQGAKSTAKAAAVMGMRFKSIPAGATPESFQSGAQQVVDDKPAIVIMAGVDASLIEKQLAAMKQEGIVTVNQATADPPSDFDVFLLDKVAYKNIGSAMARYTILHSEGKANVLFVDQSIFTFTESLGEGLKETFANECPECSYKEVDSLPEEVGTKIPEKVVSEIQRDSSIDWAIFAYGAMDLGVPEAIRAAGLPEVKLLSQAMAANNYENLKSGVEPAGFAASEEEGIYFELDQAARVLAGQKTLNRSSVGEAWAISGEDVTFDPNTEEFQQVPNFKQEYEALWSGK